MRTGAARGHVGNFHEAGFYSSDREFLDLMVPFINDGLDAGDPVLVGHDPRKCDLLRAALPRSSRSISPSTQASTPPPARAIEAYRRQFDRYLTGAYNRSASRERSHTQAPAAGTTGGTATSRR